MSQPYRELVALRVVFSKIAQKYRLIHYYRLVQPEQRGSPMELQGYDMDRATPVYDIEEKLRSAYAPAVLSEWFEDEPDRSSLLLQLQPGATPEELNLGVGWSLRDGE